MLTVYRDGSVESRTAHAGKNQAIDWFQEAVYGGFEREIPLYVVVFEENGTGDPCVFLTWAYHHRTQWERESFMFTRGIWASKKQGHETTTDLPENKLRD